MPYPSLGSLNEKIGRHKVKRALLSLLHYFFLLFHYKMTGSNLELVEVYSEGIKAWFPDEELGWVSASVIAKEVDAKSIKISFQDDENAEKVKRNAAQPPGTCTEPSAPSDSNMCLKRASQMSSPAK